MITNKSRVCPNIESVYNIRCPSSPSQRFAYCQDINGGSRHARRSRRPRSNIPWTVRATWNSRRKATSNRFSMRPLEIQGWCTNLLHCTSFMSISVEWHVNLFSQGDDIVSLIVAATSYKQAFMILPQVQPRHASKSECHGLFLESERAFWKCHPWSSW